MFQPPPCLICRSTRTARLFSHQGYEICRCRGCGHHWAVGDGPKDYRREPSRLEFYKAQEAPHRALMRKNLRLVAPWIRSGGKILDFGCGSGFFTLEARLAGFDSQGVDLAEWVTDAAAHWQIPLHVGRIEHAGHAPESFDAVVAIVSMEHLPDPLAMTGTLARLIRPGGVFAVLSVPHVGGLPWKLLGERWWDLDPPMHLQWFSRRSIRSLCEQNGLRVRKVRTTGVGYAFFATLAGRGRQGRSALDDLQYEVNSGESAPQGGLRTLLSRAAVPFANSLLNLTRLGNNLTVIAVKE
ncbi:MAG: methyltransferase domain-containing protein [Candidatus Brocadiae bacterium]|nr:methyltransferase domain-containing protein [Candidatus Brocadiia bacterium]